MEQRLHDYWQNVAVDDRQRRILMCSGSSGTEELCCAGIGYSLHKHTELVLDSFRNVQSMKLGMHNPRQATIKFPGVTDNTRCNLTVIVFGAPAKAALQ